MDRYGAAAMFDFGGEVTSVVPYGNGHINDTYAVTCSLAGGSVRFILQRLNPVVFPDRAGLMRNMIAVTGFLRKAVIRDGGDPERECLRLIPLKDGSPYLTDESGETAYTAGTDYVADAVTGLLSRLPGGAIPEGGTVKAAYVHADVSKVTSEDIMGGIDPQSGLGTGLELIDEVFPRFRLVPSIVLAPRFCEDPAVAVVMAAKCEDINGLFKAVCVVDGRLSDSPLFEQLFAPYLTSTKNEK